MGYPELEDEDLYDIVDERGDGKADRVKGDIVV